MLLRIFPISSFYIVDGNLEWLQIQIFGFDAFYEFFLLYENYLGRQGFLTLKNGVVVTLFLG